MTFLEESYEEYGLISISSMSDKDLKKYIELIYDAEGRLIEIRGFISAKEDILKNGGWTERDIDSLLEDIDEAITEFKESKTVAYTLIKEREGTI